jgi:hypothetical protein
LGICSIVVQIIIKVLVDIVWVVREFLFKFCWAMFEVSDVTRYSRLMASIARYQDS